MFVFLVKLAVMVALAYFLRPKPVTQKPPKAIGIEEFQIPTAEEGRPIQVLFGKRRERGPNVVWYGDLKASPIWR